jgi:hypothetical protein
VLEYMVDPEALEYRQSTIAMPGLSPDSTMNDVSGPVRG